MLGPLCNQIVDLETDAKTIYYSSPKKELFKRTGYSTKKIFKSIHHSLRPMGCMPLMTLCLWRFLCTRDAGCRGNKFTAMPQWMPLSALSRLHSTVVLSSNSLFATLQSPVLASCAEMEPPTWDKNYMYNSDKAQHFPKSCPDHKLDQ